MKVGWNLFDILRRNMQGDQIFKAAVRMAHSERYSYSPTLKWNPHVEEYFVKAYGADHFSRICEALTRPSTYSCIRVNTLRSTIDSVIENLTSILNETPIKSGGGEVNISGGSDSFPVASDKKLGEVLDKSQQNGEPPSGLYRNDGKCPIYKCPLSGLDNVVFVKGSGPHKIDYTDAPGQQLKEVIISRKCAEAVLRGAQIFVPGVLACSAHVEQGDTVAVSVAVEKPSFDGGWNFGFTRGTVLQGLETDPQYHERGGLYIGQGATMMSRAGIFRASSGVAVEMKNRVFHLPSFYDVLEGKIFLQNLPSIVTAHVLDPQPGERILDMCAAPGGKTTGIAILKRDEGEVIAVDRSHNKVLDIKKLAAEMGLNCIKAYKLDSLRAVRRANDSIGPALSNHEKETLDMHVDDSSIFCPPNSSVSSVAAGNNDESCIGNAKSIGNEKAKQAAYCSKAEARKCERKMRNGPGRNHAMGGRVENSKGFEPDSFDRVLLDAPCSALGLRPRLFAGEETIESLRNHAKYQRRMFDQAVKLVRPGGVIVYSTCTINPGENEALVRYALDTYQFLSLASQQPRIGGPGLVGGCKLSDVMCAEEWLRPGEEELVQRFDPSSPLDTIGFFIAKFNVGIQKE